MENQIQQPREKMVLTTILMQDILNHFVLTPHIMADILPLYNRIMQETSEENQKKTV
jgi:hypothetical protein